MVSHLLSDLEKFEEALAREYHAHSSGQKDEFESSKIYKQFKHLFSKEHIAEAHKDILTREGKLLYDSFVSNFIGNELKKLSDKEASFEASAMISVNNQQIPFRQVTSLINWGD